MDVPDETTDFTLFDVSLDDGNNLIIIVNLFFLRLPKMTPPS